MQLDIKENGNEKGNQGIKEHSQIVSNCFVLTSALFRESKHFNTYLLDNLNILHLACK